jgi:hypothetical protein
MKVAYQNDMIMKHSSPLTTLICAACLLPASLLARDAATIKAPLHGTGDADATGTAIATLQAQQSELIVQARRLGASHAYNVEIAGIVEGTLTTDKNGRGSIRFRTPAKAGQPALDFDPRGATLRLLDDATSVLEGVISGRGEDNGAVIHEAAELETGDDSPAKAHGHASFTVTPSGLRTFRVDLTGLDDSPLHVFVDGVERGEVHHRGKTGAVVFSSSPANDRIELLDFDPRGSSVDIISDDHRTIFSGRMEAKVRRVNQAVPSVNRLALPATASAPAGSSASARLRIDERARKHFSVEVEDVPAGDYDFAVDGTVVAQLTVAAVTGGTQGELEFAAGDDDPTETPLTFDPVGKTLTISQNGAALFEGLFNPDMTGSGAPAPEPASRFEEMLTSTGLDADATARAGYRADDKGRHKFAVEVEKVDAGAYQLVVAGVVRGTITAKATAAGVVGEIEFATRRMLVREPSSGGNGGHGGDDPAGTSGGTGTTGGGGADDPAGDDHGSGGSGADDAIDGHELPLNFDPRGQTIEIRSAAGVFFSHILGTGSAGDPGTAVPTFETEVALLNAGVIGGTAGAKLRQREDGRVRFEVELEHAPAGDYDLVVDGTVRGTFHVTVPGVSAEVEFESEPEAGAGTLNFPVQGKEIDIVQGGVTLFSRVFPVE